MTAPTSRQLTAHLTTPEPRGHGWHGWRCVQSTAEEIPHARRMALHAEEHRDGRVGHTTHPWDAVEVRVGQVWADNDKRHPGRYVQIAELPSQLYYSVGDGYRVAVCRLVVRRSDGAWEPTGRVTRIRLDRFRPTATGYRLVDTEVRTIS